MVGVGVSVWLEEGMQGVVALVVVWLKERVLRVGALGSGA